LESIPPHKPLLTIVPDVGYIGVPSMHAVPLDPISDAKRSFNPNLLELFGRDIPSVFSYTRKTVIVPFDVACGDVVPQ
jgi:hypothetical protein